MADDVRYRSREKTHSTAIAFVLYGKVKRSHVESCFPHPTHSFGFQVNVGNQSPPEQQKRMKSLVVGRGDEG